MYEVEITPEGLRHLDWLPERVRFVALETILGPIPENPQRGRALGWKVWSLGKPLVGELEGLHSARRGDYRIVYEVLEEDQVVVIHRVQHRRDIYRRR